METDPVSETVCLNEVKTMDSVQNGRHVYCNTLSSETFLSTGLISVLFHEMYCYVLKLQVDAV